MASPIKLSPMVAPFLVEAPGLKELAKIEKDVAKIGKRIGDSLGAAGRRLTTAVTVPIVGLGAASVKMATDANRSLASIGTLIPGQSEKLQQYKKQLTALAIESATGFNVLSEGLYQSISSLGDGEQAFTALRVANRAAVAGIADTKDAVTLLSGVSKGYNDVSDEMLNKVSDLAFTTVKLGVTTFPELAANMGKVTPIAASLGVSVEELFGNMATLTGVTGETSEVSTQLASVMGALIKGGGALDDAFAKLGAKSGKDLIEKTGSLNNALMALKESVGGSEAEFGKLLGRKEAILAGFTLTGIQAENAAKKVAAMRDAVGATNEAYKEQTDGINKAEFQFKRFIQTMKALGRAIGDKLLPILTRWGEKLAPLIDSLGEMNDKTLESGIKIAGLAAVVGPSLMVFGKLFTVVSSIAGAIGGAGGLSAVLVTLTGPVGVALAAIAGITAAFVLFKDELQPVTDAVKGELTSAFKSFSVSTSEVDGDFSGMIDSMRELVSMLAPAWGVMARITVKFATGPMKLLIGAFERIVTTANNVLKIFRSIKGVFVGLSQYVSLTFEKIGMLWTSLEKKLPLLKFFGDQVRGVKEAFKGLTWFLKTGYEYLGKFFQLLPDVLPMVSGWLAEKAGAVSGSVQRGANEYRDSKGAGLMTNGSMSSNDKMEIDINVNSNAPTGVNVKGRPATVRKGNGQIMPAGAEI